MPYHGSHKDEVEWSAEELARSKKHYLRGNEFKDDLRHLAKVLGVVSSIVRFIAIRHPLAFYGIPGIAFLVAAGIFAALPIDLYFTKGFFSINMTALAAGLGIFGLILVVAGMAFYIMANNKKASSR